MYTLLRFYIQMNEKWLYGPENIPGLSRNGPQARYRYEANEALASVFFFVLGVFILVFLLSLSEKIRHCYNCKYLGREFSHGLCLSQFFFVWHRDICQGWKLSTSSLEVTVRLVIQ